MNENDRSEPVLRGVRSLLFTPGDKPDRFDKGAAAGADLVILDLEDAVAPDAKDAARHHAIEYLRSARSGRTLRALRINDPTTPLGIGDLAALRASGSRPDLLVVPKVENAATIMRVGGTFDETATKRLPVLPLIESAAGTLHADEILAERDVIGVLVGAADLAADLGIPEPTRPLLTVPRGQIVLTAAAYGKPAFDTPWFALNDEAGLRRDIGAAFSEGFSGKSAVHPAQIAPINAVWTPSSAQVAKARRVIAVANRGVGTVDGQMVDEAMARRARNVLSRDPQTAGD
jgi:(S)-citramalyl-CoA lyase